MSQKKDIVLGNTSCLDGSYIPLHHQTNIAPFSTHQSTKLSFKKKAPCHARSITGLR